MAKIPRISGNMMIKYLIKKNFVQLAEQATM